MTWVRIEEGYDEHGKVVGLSDAAFRADVEAFCYAARGKTDGALPAGVVKRRWKKAPELVAAHRWHEGHGCGTETCIEGPEDGFVIHDYLAYNPSRQLLEERRAKKQAAGRAGGEARAKALAEAESNPGSGSGSGSGSLASTTSLDAESKDAPTASIEEAAKTKIVPPDRWGYFLDALPRYDETWEQLTYAALVKIAKLTNVEAVTYALSCAWESKIRPRESAYGWVAATAAGRASAVPA